MIRARTLTFALGLAVLSLAACKSEKPAQQAASSEPTAPSSEWVAENPTEAAVPVDLPKTAMTSGPASEAPAPAPKK